MYHLWNTSQHFCDNIYCVKLQNKKSQRLPYLFIIAGTIGLAMSFLITTDKIQLLKDPSYIPPCNISPFISCGSVMSTPQAEVFGFSNSLIGLAFFGGIIALGFALLSGAQFKRWLWLLLQGATGLSAIFVYWLAYQSIFHIGSLCPYCMVVWAVTIPLALYVKLYNVGAGYLPVSKKCAAWSQKYNWVFLIALYALILVPILWKFWPYWQMVMGF